MPLLKSPVFPKTLNDILSFYLKLPREKLEEIIAAAMDGVTLSREQKRTVDAMDVRKRLEYFFREKVLEGVGYEITRLVYEYLSTGEAGDPLFEGELADVDDDAVFDELFETMDEDNCMAVSAYILYRCSDEGYRSRHFQKFVNSKKFRSTLSGKWEEDAPAAPAVEEALPAEEPAPVEEAAPAEETAPAQETVPAQVTVPADEPAPAEITAPAPEPAPAETAAPVQETPAMAAAPAEEPAPAEETAPAEEPAPANEAPAEVLDPIEAMLPKQYYVGYIRVNGTFYNFFPAYIITKNDAISYIEDVRTRYPDFGAINLHYDSMNGVPARYLNRNVIPDSLFAICFDESELEPNTNKAFKYMLNLDRLCGTERLLSHRIRYADEIGVYRLVTPKADYISDERYISGRIEINEYCDNNENVVIAAANTYRGPFLTKSDDDPDAPSYIEPGAKKNNYIIRECKKYHAEIMEFRLDGEMGYETHSYVFIPGKRIFSTDLMSDAQLMETLTKRFDMGSISGQPDYCTNLVFSESECGREIVEARRGRIKQLTEKYRQASSEKAEVIKSLAEGMDPYLFRELAKELVPDLTLSAEAEAEYTGKISRMKERVEELEQELKTLKNAVLVPVTVPAADAAETTCREARLKELDEKIEEKQSILAGLSKQLDAAKEETERVLSSSAKAELAFNPLISSKLMEAADKWYRSEEADALDKRAETLSAFYYTSTAGEELSRRSVIDYLLTNVSRYRTYSREDILNIYICLTQNLLTVFSGAPGVGKTSICNIVANSLGLNNFSKYSPDISNRYVPLSVEKGWTSKRDLIGYFNPLTGKYDKSNGGIYDGLVQLSKEGRDSHYPFVILLDEANLSQMEYYWADFMKAADSEPGADAVINLGGGQEVVIPETLRFLATINNDETTSELSPRLLDRAWVIRLPMTEPSVTAPANYDVFTKIIPWNKLKEVFTPDSETLQRGLSAEAAELLCSIYGKFEENHVIVSPRVKNAIANYTAVAERPDMMASAVTAVDFAVTQKLLPKINGYYINYEPLLSWLADYAGEKSLTRTAQAVEEMVRYQERNMGYCRYMV